MPSRRKSIILYSVIGALSIVFAVVTVLLFDQFYTTYNALIGFNANNFSNSITIDQPVRIDFSISQKNFDRCYLRFSPNSEASLETSLTVTLLQNDTVLVQKELPGDSIYFGQYINLVPDTALKKGTSCTLLVESELADEPAAYRLVLGSSLASDITDWYCGDALETGAAQPELYTVYLNHFGSRSFLAYCLCLLLGLAALALPRTRWWQRSRLPISVIALVAAPPVLLYFLEMLAMGSILHMAPRLILCNLLLLWGLELIVFALSGRPHLSVFAAALLSAVAGVASHFVMMYRGTAINPADLFAITAAADVVAHYSFVPDAAILMTFSVFFAGCCLAWRYRTVLPLRHIAGAGCRAAGLCAGAICLAFCLTSASLNWSGAILSLKFNTDSARRNGMLYNFAQSLSTLNIQKPEGYSTENASAQAEHWLVTEQAEPDVHPDIILIMSETLADYSKIIDMSHMSQDSLPFLHSLEQDDDPRTFVGTTVVPVYGSGTCNSEFEAITGASMRNFDSSCFPYLQYILPDTPSLASHLKTLGYTTTALHPGIADTWHRDSVYPSLGFDTILFDEDFPYQDTMNELISDRACFNTILDMLPQDINEAPAFILNVTIQNHGGYKARDDFEQCIFAESDDPLFNEAELYNSLLYYSDLELEQLIDQLSRRERPTLLVLFGDHQPSLNTEYLEYIHYDSAISADPLLQYTTPYLVWANYDIDTSALPQTVSTNYLGAIALKTAGLPMNGWYQFLYEQMQTIPVYSLMDVRMADGSAPPADHPVFSAYTNFQYGALRERNKFPHGFF